MMTTMSATHTLLTTEDNPVIIHRISPHLDVTSQRDDDHLPIKIDIPKTPIATLGNQSHTNVDMSQTDVDKVKGLDAEEET